MIILRSKFFSDNKIGGIYVFPEGTGDQEIISHILKDFALKLYGILSLYANPKIGCSSLCTYEIFRNFWAIPDSEDLSHSREEIYSEIPSSYVAKEIEKLSRGKFKESDVTRSFGGGEFPIVKIWKEHNKVRKEIIATYDIMR